MLGCVVVCCVVLCFCSSSIDRFVLFSPRFPEMSEELKEFVRGGLEVYSLGRAGARGASGHWKSNKEIGEGVVNSRGY